MLLQMALFHFFYGQVIFQCVCVCVYTHHIFSTRLSVSGHFGCSHILDNVLNNASNNWGLRTFGDEFCFEHNEFEIPMGHPGESFHRAAGSQNLVFREKLELEILFSSCVTAKTMRCEWHDLEKCTLLKSRGQVQGPMEHLLLWSWWRQTQGARKGRLTVPHTWWSCNQGTGHLNKQTLLLWIAHCSCQEPKASPEESATFTTGAG